MGSPYTQEFGLDRDRFRQLSLDGSSLFELLGVIECAGPVDAVMVARLSACAEKRRAGVSWPETIAAVLAEVPATPEPARLVAQ